MRVPNGSRPLKFARVTCAVELLCAAAAVAKSRAELVGRILEIVWSNVRMGR